MQVRQVGKPRVPVLRMLDHSCRRTPDDRRPRTLSDLRGLDSALDSSARRAASLSDPQRGAPGAAPSHGELGSASDLDPYDGHPLSPGSSVALPHESAAVSVRGRPRSEMAVSSRSAAYAVRFCSRSPCFACLGSRARACAGRLFVCLYQATRAFQKRLWLGNVRLVLALRLMESSAATRVCPVRTSARHQRQPKRAERYSRAQRADAARTRAHRLRRQPQRRRPRRQPCPALARRLRRAAARRAATRSRGPRGASCQCLRLLWLSMTVSCAAPRLDAHSTFRPLHKRKPASHVAS